MTQEGVTRVPLTMHEDTNPPISEFGRFQEFSEFIYYPFGALEPSEQELIDGKKDYIVTSLVQGDIVGTVSYPAPGLEFIRRTRVSGKFLPPMDDRSPLNYLRQSGTFSVGDSLKRYVRDSIPDTWTPDMVCDVIERGIKEYQAITSRLMESSGVGAGLDEMNNQPLSSIDNIFYQMRTNIDAAKK
jgi:hypothetical protein